jgi:hypothetical protein
VPRSVVLSTLLVAPAALGQILTQSTVTSVGGANALSTPAARHLVRMRSGTYLLALQCDRAAPNTGLTLFRSDDDGQSWSYSASLNPNASDRHTADLLRAGDDLALVASYDGPSIVPDASLDPARQVRFQWWRAKGSGWEPEPPVAVFDPAPGFAYHRGEIAIDAAGRIWVQAFQRGATRCDPAKDLTCAQCLNVDNGDNYGNEVVVSVSADGGRTFSPAQTVGTTMCRAGGRIIDLGQKLLLIWNDYSANENGSRVVTRFVTRELSDPIGSWSDPQDAFTDAPADGIYHGAALSAVADGQGGLHLVYKDQNDQLLWYRHFDGHGFTARVQVDDSRDDWALQPATMMRDGELFVLANHRTGVASYETRMWRLSTGLGPQQAASLGDDGAFHGYPSLPDSIPEQASTFPYAFASTPNPDEAGEEVTLRVSVDPPRADVTAAPGALRSVDGMPASATLSIVPRNGFRGTLALSVSGAPSSAQATLEPATLTVPDGATATLLTLLPRDTEPGDYRVVVRAVSAQLTTQVIVPWTVARSPPAPGRGGGGDPPTGTTGASASAGSGCSSTTEQPAALLAVAWLVVARRRRRWRVS